MTASVALAAARRRALLAGVTVLACLAALVPAAADAAEGPEIRRLAGPDRVTTAVAISQSAYETAEVAVLARADDFADALVGAPLAAQLDAPILLTPGDHLPATVSDELDRLGVSRVLVLGGTRAISQAVIDGLGDREVQRVAGTSRFGTAAEVVAAMKPESSTVYVATGLDFPDALSAGPLAAAGAHAILLVTHDAVPIETRETLDALAPERIVILGGTAVVGEGVAADLATTAPITRIAGADRYATAAAAFVAAVESGADPDDVWLASGANFADALVAGPVVGATGATMLLVSPDRLEAPRIVYDRLRARGAELRRATLLGGNAAISGDAERQLDGILLGSELPRGGRLLFPEHRLVALYGNARSTAMGALGEQPPEEAAERAKQVAAAWERPGSTILPTFELIVTVATRHPGPDGMYRSVSEDHEIQRYLDVARANDLYLVLDIQPGRSDFLTEVRRYDRWLAEPDVGIALDPEWRMGPNEVPGDGVGQVDAAEVNQVIEHLAGIVRDGRLPQKLLIVHQFQTRMITNRDQLLAPPELAVNIHMDGFGTRAQKLDTYRWIRAEDPFTMGFKLFYDEDIDIFGPDDVLSLDPVPVFISYQ